MEIKRLIFRILFSESEQTSIINALFRRAQDNSTAQIAGDENVRSTCQRIAMYLMK